MAYEYQFRGLYLEDFEVGKEYFSPARTVTEADVSNFAGLSGDFNPLHTDEEFAKKNLFGTRIAHGALGFIISTGLSNQMGIFAGTTIAFLELSIRYPAPLEIGATVHLEMTPTELRHSSKPGRGVLTMDANLVDHNGNVITQCNWKLMMKARE